jgi:hypothetical protein
MVQQYCRTSHAPPAYIFRRLQKISLFTCQFIFISSLSINSKISPVSTFRPEMTSAGVPSREGRVIYIPVCVYTYTYKCTVYKT